MLPFGDFDATLGAEVGVVRRGVKKLRKNGGSKPEFALKQGVNLAQPVNQPGVLQIAKETRF
jgi:hypothetical protein